jgi:twitching motility protein PilT
MISMEASLEREFQAGKISAEEAYMKSSDKNRFRAAFEAEKAAAEAEALAAAEAAAAAAAAAQEGAEQ